jgi:hypothetical protein
VQTDDPDVTLMEIDPDALGEDCIVPDNDHESRKRKRE